MVCPDKMVFMRYSYEFSESVCLDKKWCSVIHISILGDLYDYAIQLFAISTNYGCQHVLYIILILCLKLIIHVLMLWSCMLFYHARLKGGF